MTEIHTLSKEYEALVRQAREERAAYMRAATQRLIARVKSWFRPQAARPLAGANA
jgi:hypothetical protein